MSFTFSIETGPSTATENWVIDQLEDFNERKAGSRNRNAFAVLVNDERGIRVAGLLGSRHWNHLFISAIFVDESERGKGIGRQLLLKAEELALQEKCTAIYLDTFDFQAPGFYEKLGFEVFGVLKDHPAGHQRYSMVKTLAC